MLQLKVDGFDAVSHVLKIGRLDEAEIKMPCACVILKGLASDPNERAQLAERCKIIVTHCDSTQMMMPMMNTILL
jgi:hypothetical protein